MLCDIYEKVSRTFLPRMVVSIIASCYATYMKKATLLLSAVLIASLFPFEASAGDHKRNHIVDGGMMLHTGYLSGSIESLNYKASGMPFGVGGVLHVHLGEHFRIGGEGYVSTLKQMGNGSYIKYGWGGILGDFIWTFKHVMPYAGLTVGGGSNTDFLMMDSPNDDFRIDGEAYYRKRGFMLIAPYIGCDFILSHKIHLTAKMDFLSPIGKDLQIPLGPRLYFGIIFYH